MIRLSDEHGRVYSIGRGEVWGSASAYEIEYWLRVSADGKGWTILRKGEDDHARVDTDDTYPASEIRRVVEEELGLYERPTDDEWREMGLK